MFVEKSSRRATVIQQLVLLSLISLTTGCAGQFNNWLHNGFKVGPDYMKPAAQVADEYAEVADPQITNEPPDYSDWWTVFNDPVLDRLIAIASQQGNHDPNAYGFRFTGAGLSGPNPPRDSLREAALRVLQAREALRRDVGNLAPGNSSPSASVLAGGAGGAPIGQQEAFFDYQRRQSSKETFPSNLPKAKDILTPKRSYSIWDLGIRAGWEVDIWGKFRRAIEAGRADLDLTIEDYDAILVAILSDVAQCYYEIRTLQQGLCYTVKNVEAQRGALELAQTKFRAGATTELDVQQAQTNLARTQSLVPEIRKRLRLKYNMLCFILGYPPHNIDYLLGKPPTCEENLLIPAVPPQVAVGIPADLLRRRPDLRAAERNVASESARIGIRAADLFPSISIFGTIQYEAESFKDLFGGKAVAGTLGAPSIRWPILHYGRIRSNINLQDALFQEAAARYERVVLQANREVEDAIVAFLDNQRKAAHLAVSVEALERSVEIALTQYRGGITDFNRVFTLQSDLAVRQNELAIAQGDTIAELIAIYRNLGGGWQIRLNPPPHIEHIKPPAPENVPPPLPEGPNNGLAPPNRVPQVPMPMPGNGATTQPMATPEAPAPGDPNNGSPPATMMRFLPPAQARQDAQAWNFTAQPAVVPVGHWETQMPVPQR